MTEQPLVTVVMPVYNGEPFLRQALDSVLLQTYRNLEVLAVDDGSTDGSLAILEQYAARDSRVRVLRQANGGVAMARNRAILEARGDYIAPIDADDLWLPEKIERQMARMLIPFEENGFVYCWWAWIDEANVVVDRSPRWRMEGHVLEQLIFINFTGNASAPLFRKSCLIEAGLYNERLAAEQAGGCEDWEVALRIAARHPVRAVPQVLLGYRRRKGSMSSACDTMRRSQAKVMEGVRALRPGLKPALFRASANQFAMYLAGLSFWAGRPWSAIGWGLRAGVRLPVLVAPFVLRMLLRRRRTGWLVMRPGERLDELLLPPPLLPYDRIGLPTLRQVVLFLATPAIRVWWWLSLFALRAEARKSERSKEPRKPRVWAMACWHFPMYSQTFVYREIQALMHGGFEVRFAYVRRNSRRDLPEECAEVWKIGRRVLLLDACADWALSYYWRNKPERVRELMRTVASASGWTQDEILQYPPFRLAFAFARMAEAWKPDYVHTYFFYEQALFGLATSVLLDIPRGVSCYADHMMNDSLLKLVGMHLRSCDVVVATSQRIRGELEELAGGELASAIVKPNGIDPNHYFSRQRFGSSRERVYKIVAVNRIHPKKGMAYLVEAAVLLKERGVPFTIDILGDSDAADAGTVDFFSNLRANVEDARLGATIRFQGRQTAAAVREFLAEADIFVAPYVELANGDKDGIPTALLEAMASGCAVVATDAGSILEVVTDGVDGLVVPQKDGRRLADVLEALCRDEGLRQRLARRGVERVKAHFDVGVCEGAFHEKIREAIAVRDPFRFGPRENLGAGKLRIALLSYEYPPETGFGGIGTYTWYQARALARLGHEVHVLAGFRETMPLRTTLQENVLVHRFSGLSVWSSVGRLLRMFRCEWTQLRLANAWSMAEGLRQLQTRYRFDVVEMPECGGEGFLLPKSAPTPRFVRFHGPAGLIMDTYDVPRADRVLCRWVEQVGIRKADRFTSCSAFLAGEVRVKLGVAKEVPVIYNGIDLELFDQSPVADLQAEYGVAEGQTTVLFAGRMEPRKGVHLLGEIVRSVAGRPVTFLLAGDDLFGYVRTTLRPYLQVHGIEDAVKVVGKLGMQELRACARAVDIYLLPSLWENCPYACLEAMAAGRAVVCSNQGGMPELIEHGVNGLLAEVGCAGSFAAELATLIEDEALRKRLGKAARETVERRFRDDAIAIESANAYAAACKAN